MPDEFPPVADARAYSRAELVSDALVHLAGITMALAAVPVLIALTAVWRGDLLSVGAVALYGVTLIAMLVASLSYNHLPGQRFRELLRRLDQSAIYLKIAGTYTPFALLSGVGAGLLAAIWAVAGLACSLTFLLRRRPTGLAVAVCLSMGWAGLVGGRDILAALSTPVLSLMVAGGILYSLGTPFLLAGRLKFHNTIWHGFVVAASIVFFVAVFLLAAQGV